MKPTLLLVIVGLVVALTGFGGYNAIYAPHQTQVRLIRSQIADEQANQAMQAEVAGLLEQVERFRKRLPPERDPAWLVEHVLPIADRAGLQFDSIGRDVPQDIGALTRLSITLQGTGSYHQVGAFVDELERSEPYFRVDRLVLGPPPAAAPPEKGMVQMVVSTVYVPPVVTQPR